MPYHPYLEILFILLLLILSALFSGSETALTAASKARMHALEKSGNKHAKIVNLLRQRKNELIGAILLGNNLVNILASAMMTKVLLEYFGDAGVAYATIMMTFLILVFSEVMPKTYTFHHADKSALKIAPFIRILVWVTKPVTLTINTSIKFIFKIFGASTHHSSIHTSMDELRGAIDLHQREGEDEEIKDEKDMLKSILDLGTVTTSEIMTHRSQIEAISIETSLEDVLDFILKSPFSRFPIWEGGLDNVIGILNTKTFLRDIKLAEKNKTTLMLRDVIAQPWFVPETTTLYDQLKNFRHKNEHFALVIDEYSELMGIVTLEDILEEIVGDIRDELDTKVKGVAVEPDGSYVVEGTVTIRELNREYNWDLPDEEAATIAGLILYEAQQLPKAGQSFIFHGFRLEVLKRERNQITRIKLTPPK